MEAAVLNVCHSREAGSMVQPMQLNGAKFGSMEDRATYLYGSALSCPFVIKIK